MSHVRQPSVLPPHDNHQAPLVNLQFIISLMITVKIIDVLSNNIINKKTASKKLISVSKCSISFIYLP